MLPEKYAHQVVDECGAELGTIRGQEFRAAIIRRDHHPSAIRTIKTASDYWIITQSTNAPREPFALTRARVVRSENVRTLTRTLCRRTKYVTGRPRDGRSAFDRRIRRTFPCSNTSRVRFLEIRKITLITRRYNI